MVSVVATRPPKYQIHSLEPPQKMRAHKQFPRTFGGTPNRDPCSLWGLVWGLPRDMGLYNDYIRVIYVKGIKVPFRGPS